MTKLMTIVLLAASAVSVRAEEWKLVWSDEFDQSGLPDSTKWGYRTRLHPEQRDAVLHLRPEGERTGGRRHADHRGPEGALERSACVKVHAKSGRRGRRGREPADYTSASLTTRGKAAWTHGRIEVRAKLPSGAGTWPAIWMLGTNIDEVGWPACGEIDIMEFVGFDPGVIHANIHTKKYNHSVKTGKGDKISIPDASEAFHVYGWSGTSKKMDFSVDGKNYFTFTTKGAGRPPGPTTSRST